MMTKMIHLVIGASGQVGASLVRELKKNEDSSDVVGTFWSNPNVGTAKYFLDVTDENHTLRMIRALSPAIVWLPAYFTNVDYADKYESVNVAGMINVIKAADSCGARLVFYSTGYVFDGKGRLPYITQDIPNPINVYGKQKLSVENYVLANPRNAVIRTMGVYGVDDKRKNFAYRVLDTVSSGQKIYVPSDQWMNPITSENLAECSVDLITLLVSGLIHIAGNTPVTKYQFALDLVKRARLNDGLVIPKTSEQMNQAELRPLWSVLDWREIEKYGTKVKDYGESIKDFVRIY